MIGNGRKSNETPPDWVRAVQPQANTWYDGDEAHIDVRGLAPPGPMVAILTLIEHPDCPASVIVHHDREPIYLYPELAERHWRHTVVPGEPGEVRLQLTRMEP